MAKEETDKAAHRPDLVARELVDQEAQERQPQRIPHCLPARTATTWSLLLLREWFTPSNATHYSQTALWKHKPKARWVAVLLLATCTIRRRL